MQKMHWCTAKVNLAGKNLTIVIFDATNPVSWPEAQVIMVLHGEENIFDIKPVAISETTASAEKERLAIKYGYRPVEQVFPGRTFRMETLMPGESEEYPTADDEGKPQLIGAPTGEDDDSDGPPIGDPPLGAVFKPGKQRPAKGA
jgi:hypothetical protein